MKLPCICPSCQNQLKVKSLKCEHCETEVNGLYDLPILSQLSSEDQTFILNFVKHSGSLKDMASLLNLSYPSVRNKLDDIILKLNAHEQE